MKEIAKDLYDIGVTDRKIDLFEGQYPVPDGMTYNSYLIRDEKIAVLDTADQHFTHEWLDRLAEALAGRTPDYLIVSHMEPDHSANIAVFLKNYPTATVVASAKAFAMMKNFFGEEYEDRRLVVGEGATLCLGRHTLTFYTAPMVHWPEVIVTYDDVNKILFSADGFGKFGAGEEKLDAWKDEARRYYIGIVGKYGAQVQALLKKAARLDIRMICPLHGPVLSEDLGYYLHLYDLWSSYTPEDDGVLIAYTSVYGHTKEAALLLAEKLKERGCPETVVFDLARGRMSDAVAEAFRLSKVVFATTTYNAEIYPFMHTFLTELCERGFKKRTVGFIENGSWAPMATKGMRAMLEKCDLTYTDATVRILSALNAESKEQIAALADELCRDYIAKADKTPKNDPTAMFKIGYGLYVVTTFDGERHNGLIVNTVSQVTSAPNRIAVTINKQNYSHHIVQKTGKMNVNCLTTEAPFAIFEAFGFRSGRNTDKFADRKDYSLSANGLAVLDEVVNAYMSLEVEQYVDLDTHGMFICRVTEARSINNKETMTYTYYQDKVKPKPETEGKKGWVCKVCGYVYEGEELPEDFVCPLCKHGAQDFEKL